MIPVQVSRTKIKEKFYCFYGKIPALTTELIQTSTIVRWSNRDQQLPFIILKVLQKNCLSSTYNVLLVIFYFLSTEKQNHFTLPANENQKF